MATITYRAHVDFEVDVEADHDPVPVLLAALRELGVDHYANPSVRFVGIQF